MKLIWVDFEGKGTVVETLLPGARRIQPTNAGHVWEMRNAHSNDLIKTFLPSPVKEQLCRIIPRNTNLELPPEITFDARKPFIAQITRDGHAFFQLAIKNEEGLVQR